MKSLQQVIDTQCEKMASLAADRELAALGHHDESTGQGGRERGRGEGGREEQGGERERGEGGKRDMICYLSCTVVGQESSEGKSHLPTVIKGYMKQIEELKSVNIVQSVITSASLPLPPSLHLS